MRKKENKTGLQPGSRTCGTNQFGFFAQFGLKIVWPNPTPGLDGTFSMFVDVN